MFFILSKVLLALIYPLTWVILLFTSSLFIKNNQVKKRLVSSALVLLFFFSNPFFANLAMKNWEISPLLFQNIKHHQYAVVLTGVTSPEKEPNDRTHYQKGADRVLHTIALYRKGLIDKIIITGGNASILKDYSPESEGIFRTLIYAGIPKDDILLENKARNTAENALYTKEIIASQKEIILITSAFHMRRAKLCFEKLGFKVTPFTTDFYGKPYEWNPTSWLVPKTESLIIWNILIKEWIGSIVYKTKGYI